MKKAKIMLSAIAVFSVVGGTLAFKAHTKNDKITYFFCSLVPHTCSSTAIGNATDISSFQGTRNVTLTYTPGLTLDPNAFGLPCTNAIHPCTTTVLYYESTANQ